MKSLVDALRFLTRLPMPAAAELPGFGARAFPLVGLVLGGASVAVDFALGSLDLGVRNVAILAVSAVLTGALHYDGLADCLDALGGATTEERLRIMRDGAIGTFAVLGLVLVVAAELAALSALSGGMRWRVLLAAPMLGRAAMLCCALDAPLARADGLGAGFVRALTRSDVIVAWAVAATVAILLTGARGIGVGLLVAAASYTLRLMATRTFGGVTGDVIGASGKISEMLALVLLATA